MNTKISLESAVMASTACATLADAMRFYAAGDPIAFRRKLEMAECELARAIRVFDDLGKGEAK
jgi:hypothetical protein